MIKAVLLTATGNGEITQKPLGPVNVTSNSKLRNDLVKYAVKHFNGVENQAFRIVMAPDNRLFPLYVKGIPPFEYEEIHVQ